MRHHMEVGPQMYAEYDQYVETVTGDSRGPTLSHLLPATDSMDGRGRVSLVARIRSTALKREQEENSEANDSPPQTNLAFEALQICH